MRLPFYGAAVLCTDDSNVQAIVPTLTKLGTLQFAIPSAFDRFGAEALPRSATDNLPDFQPDFPLETSNKLIESLERDSGDRPGGDRCSSRALASKWVFRNEPPWHRCRRL